MSIYVQCALVGLLSMSLTQVVIVGKQIKKYKIANLKWSWNVYWGSDFFVQVLGTIITVGIGLMLLSSALIQYPKLVDLPFFIASFFAFVGYTGTDAATKFFSAINNRYNSAVDYKTNIADQSTGTLGTPTPAEKPVKI